MKKSILGTVAGAALLAGIGFAAAQTVVISPEHETVIRDYVTTQSIAPVEIEDDVEIVVGATLPDTVEVHALEVPEIETRYSYVVVDGRTVVLEPETRKIIHIID